MREKALEYLNRDFMLNVDIIEGIKRGLVDILYAENDGVLVKPKDGDAYMLSVDCVQKAFEIVEKVQPFLLVMHQMDIKEQLAERYGYSHGRECHHAVYIRTEPLPDSSFDIRPLTMEYAELASKTYHMGDMEYITELIEKKILVGAFDGETLMGFIGVHSEGAMGILEVLPEYRRRGIAQALEAYVINRTIEKGEVPYAQIFADNKASLELQRKLGLEISENHICWIWKEELST